MDLPGELTSVVGAKPAWRAKPRVDKEARKAEYLRAAAHAFLTHGASASMQYVADAAGTPKPVFYRIFPSRAELIEALFANVRDTVVKTHQGKWDGYDRALRVVYFEAKKDREIFLVALKTFNGDPALAPLREKLLDLVYKQTEKFFAPANCAPPGPPNRTALACRNMTGLMFDRLVAWLEDNDGLTDEKRFIWWGRIVCEWCLATREAYELDAPEPRADGSV